MPRFNHAYDFAFEVISYDEYANDVTPHMLREALLARVHRLNDEQLVDACGLYDTFAVEE